MRKILLFLLIIISGTIYGQSGTITWAKINNVINDSSDVIRAEMIADLAAKLSIANFNTYFDNRLALKTTDNLTEGSNLYFTNARARTAISNGVTGLTYNSTSGAWSLTSGYVIPTTAKETNWDLAYTLALLFAQDSTNWNTAYTDRMKWDGGSTGLVAATGRNSLDVYSKSETDDSLDVRSRSSTIVVAATNSSTKSKLAADYIGGISTINTAINALPSNGGRVILMEGTYTGTAQVWINKDNVTLEGQGKSTILDRDASIYDWTINPAKGYCVVKNLSYTNKYLVADTDVKIINCWENGSYISYESSNLTNNIIKVMDIGSSYPEKKIYNTLTAAMGAVEDNDSTNRFTIEIYGRVTETGSITLNKSYVDIIGYADACYERTGNSSARACRIDTSFNGTIANIEFRSTGTSSDVTNVAAVEVMSSNATLINVIARNNHISTAQPEYPDDTGVHAGNRLHGFMVYAPSKLYNCIGYGSPGGNHDCRGIYLEGDSLITKLHKNEPILFNCIGYGGGTTAKDYPISRCHGILAHTINSAWLVGCMGIGGGSNGGGYYTYSHSTRSSCGLKFQGTSNVVVDGGIFYGGDIGDGISCSYDSKPILNNVTAYAGIRDSSAALRLHWQTNARVNGGQFHPREWNYDWYYKNSDKKFRVTTLSPYYVYKIMLWVNTANAGDSVKLGTTLGGNDILSYYPISTTSMHMLTITPAEIDSAGYVYVTTTDSIADNDIRFNVFAIGNGDIKGCIVETSGSAKIKNASFVAPPNGEGVVILNTAETGNRWEMDNVSIDCMDTTRNAISCQSAYSGVPIIYSRVQGQLNNVSSFAEVEALLSSSNYKRK